MRESHASCTAVDLYKIQVASGASIVRDLLTTRIARMLFFLIYHSWCLTRTIASVAHDG